jgi:glycosyltransferase involved in cell wall biosynthesis
MEHVTADVELRVAGTGPQEEELAALAAGDERIRLLGHVAPAELARSYRGARAVAFVPYDEDFGYIALEAMLSGAPVITATDSGGPTELVDDGVTGFVVEPEPRAIAAAVDRLWNGRRMRRAMSRAAVERARSVSWDPVVEAIVA